MCVVYAKYCLSRVLFMLSDVYAESCMFSCFITVLIIIMLVVAMLNVMALVKEVFRSLHKNVMKYSPAQK